MKLLIEEFIPVEEISEEAKKEKLGRAPTFELHYWWARKPLITARAAVLGALISKDNLPKTFGNGDLKTSLLHILRIPKDISKGPRAHTQDPPAEFLKEAIIKTWGEIPTILDPFAGGGSIPFEALRLGCNAVAVDYNPVAYLILKATLEYPKKYGMKLYYDVKKYAEQIFNELKEELGRFYPKHDGKDVAAYIFAWVVKCPQCGFETPLVGSWQLAKTKKGKEHYLAYEVEDDELKLEIKEGKAPEGNVSRGNGICLRCGAHIPNEEVVKQIRENEKERMLAVVLLNSGSGGKEYDVPSEEDLKAFEEAEKELKKSWFAEEMEDESVLEEIESTITSFDPDLWRKKREVELAGMKLVMDCERKWGRSPEDVSADGRGYDIESFDPESGEKRRIEVKSFSGEPEKVTLSENEFKAAKFYGDKYYLYIVKNALEAEDCSSIEIIQDPANNLHFEIEWRPYYVWKYKDVA